MSEDISSNLQSRTETTYGGDYHKAVLEQYELYVRSAEYVSTRRLTSNRSFLTLNAALVAFYGIQVGSLSNGTHRWGPYIAAVGIVVSILWYSIISSFRRLNSVKFEIIHELETLLPFAIFDYEWQLAEASEKSNRSGDSRTRRWSRKFYIPVTRIERLVPIVFLGIHVYAILRIV